MAAKTAQKAPAKPAVETKAPETKAPKGKAVEAKETKAADAPKGKAVEAKAAEAPKKTAGGGLAKLVTPSEDLAPIVGAEALPRAQVVSKVWDHIRKNNLQNPANKREILADASLKKVFGKDKATMFEMNKLLSAHLS